MRLRNMTPGPVFTAAGVENITRKGYWYHRLLYPFGLRYTGSTFIAKTCTFNENAGNMPIKADGETPREWLPRCIYVDRKNQLALNCVGLSNLGFKFYLDSGCWQKQSEPFFLSFMAIGEDPAERLKEDSNFVELLREYLPSFTAPVGLERNFSCPNLKHGPGYLVNTKDFVDETWTSLDKLQELDVPVVAKFNLHLPVDLAAKLATHPACDAITISNTVPFGTLPELFDWGKWFPDGISPLTKRGFEQPGGLSGKPLFKPVVDWISRFRQLDGKTPLIACGGILTPSNVTRLAYVGANGIQVGSGSFLASTKVHRVIKKGNQLLTRP